MCLSRKGGTATPLLTRAMTRALTSRSAVAPPTAPSTSSCSAPPRSFSTASAVPYFFSKRSVDDLGVNDLWGKTALVRVDFNVPLDAESKVTDDSRIVASVPTISYLTERGAKVLLLAHMGRPKLGAEPRLSLAPVLPRLRELLQAEVALADDCVGPAVDEACARLKPGEVLLLENVRLHAEETTNDLAFAQQLAKNADLFVNDAFGAAHRAHCSTQAVTNFVSPSVAGLLMHDELAFFKSALRSPDRPFAAIIGGAKVSSKIGVMEALLEKVDKMVIGGAMAFTFLKARGVEVGASLVEEAHLKTAARIEALAAQKGVQLYLPTDAVVADKFAANATTKTVRVEADAHPLTYDAVEGIPAGWMGLDIGEDSIREIKEMLADCRTVVWNGPMGVIEMRPFQAGTYEIARDLAELTERTGCLSIVGGGDSAAAVHQAGVGDRISHISTGGGAALELLEGRELPGVAALDD